MGHGNIHDRPSHGFFNQCSAKKKSKKGRHASKLQCKASSQHWARGEPGPGVRQPWASLRSPLDPGPFTCPVFTAGGESGHQTIKLEEQPTCHTEEEAAGSLTHCKQGRRECSSAGRGLAQHSRALGSVYSTKQNQTRRHTPATPGEWVLKDRGSKSPLTI